MRTGPSENRGFSLTLRKGGRAGIRNKAASQGFHICTGFQWLSSVLLTRGAEGVAQEYRDGNFQCFLFNEEIMNGKDLLVAPFLKDQTWPCVESPRLQRLEKGDGQKHITS